MLQVAVCDDEERMRDYLEGLLSNRTDCKVSKYESGVDLLADKHKFDIFLLDIGLGGMNGIEIAKQIRKSSKAVIIFITRLKEYVFDAFDVDAFHYLLKPVNETKFMEVFDKAVKESERPLELDTLVIKVSGEYHNIPKESILYAENAARKIILHTQYDKIEYYAKMDDLEAALGKQFYRCHRGYLVQLKAVQSYDTSRIKLTNGEEIYMAKRKYTNFTSAYLEFLRR